MHFYASQKNGTRSTEQKINICEFWFPKQTFELCLLKYKSEELTGSMIHQKKAKKSETVLNGGVL